MSTELDTAIAVEHFRLRRNPKTYPVGKAISKVYSREGSPSGYSEDEHGYLGAVGIGYDGYGAVQWWTIDQLADWTNEKTGTALIELVCGVDKLPKQPTAILMHHPEANQYVIYDPHAGGPWGMVKLLSSGVVVDVEEKVLANDDVLRDFEVVGLKKRITLAEVLRRWSKKPLKSWGWRASGSALVCSTVGFAADIALTGSLGQAIFAGGAMLAVGAAVETSLTPRTAWRRWQNRALESSYAAPEAERPQLSASLVDRFQQVLSVHLPVEPAQKLAQLRTSGTYVLRHLERLGAQQEREEASALLLDHLPKALTLYRDTLEHTLSEQATAEAEKDLLTQLKLIAVEAESVRARIEDAVRREQGEHTRFLSAKLRRSDLDLD